jgi:hypothetical protein
MQNHRGRLNAGREEFNRLNAVWQAGVGVKRLCFFRAVRLGSAQAAMLVFSVDSSFGGGLDSGKNANWFCA